MGVKCSKTPNSVKSVRRLFILASYSPDQWNVFAGNDLQACKVNGMTPVKLDIAAREIVADHADQMDGAESWPPPPRGWPNRPKAAGSGAGSVNGIQGREADNQHAHSSSGFRSCRRRTVEDSPALRNGI